MTRSGEVDETVEDYLRAGAQAVWIVDPRRRTVAIRSKAGLAVMTDADTLDGGDVVPGFGCAVREIFSSISPPLRFFRCRNQQRAGNAEDMGAASRPLSGNGIMTS